MESNRELCSVCKFFYKARKADGTLEIYCKNHELPLTPPNVCPQYKERVYYGLPED